MRSGQKLLRISWIQPGSIVLGGMDGLVAVRACFWQERETERERQEPDALVCALLLTVEPPMAEESSRGGGGGGGHLANDQRGCARAWGGSQDAAAFLKPCRERERETERERERETESGGPLPCPIRRAGKQARERAIEREREREKPEGHAQ